MRQVIPCLTLLCPGSFSSPEALRKALRAAGLEREVRIDDGTLELGEVGIRLVDDPDLGAAFERGVDVTPKTVAEIAKAGRAAVVDVALPFLEEARAVAEVVRALKVAGGLALRMEGSGGAWAFETWLECVSDGSVEGIYEASVVFVRDEHFVFTCGMHQLGWPDAEIAMADPRAAVGWLQTFQLFQLLEKPLLAAGHTFQPDAASKRRILERWPDARHRVGDGRHNPFGLFRFLPEDAPPRRVVDPVPVVVPSLVAILTAAEREKGRPLGREEVEAIVDKSAAMTMSLEDALALEKSRGYADLDPELAYEQWSIVRETQ
ncbi:MAG: hypothetical protein U0230_26140 [Polyangiales bacterium]